MSDLFVTCKIIIIGVCMPGCFNTLITIINYFSLVHYSVICFNDLRYYVSYHNKIIVTTFIMHVNTLYYKNNVMSTR